MNVSRATEKSRGATSTRYVNQILPKTKTPTIKVGVVSLDEFQRFALQLRFVE